MRTDEFDFHLPSQLIAQLPAEPRDSSRLLHFGRATGEVAHRAFSDLTRLLNAGDLLVFNDAKVMPARFTLIKPTGGRVRGLFLEEPGPGEWLALLKGLGPMHAGRIHRFDGYEAAAARVVESFKGGQYRLEVEGPDAATLLAAAGSVPLPPYIRGGQGGPLDRERYQTVYAATPGSVAAPTAGLHFTRELLARLDAANIRRTTLTLHVGLGTFRPVNAERLEDHQMHAERYVIPPSAASAINDAKQAGRRVIAVGTTVARVLESQSADRSIEPTHGQTDIFIRPPHHWKHVDALLTNFHLPRSTLLALVAAFVGLEAQRRLYQIAVREGYRFFSYGDAMLLE